MVDLFEGESNTTNRRNSLVKRETTLEQEFTGHAYRREDWLRDQTVLEKEKQEAENA